MHNTSLTTSPKGLELIKRHEGLRLNAYFCPAGKLTVGYGHVIAKGQRLNVITLDQANQLLISDCRKAETAIKGWVRVPLNQNQFDALVSFIFNIGGANFHRSTLLRQLNAGQSVAAADQFLRWNQHRNPRTGGHMVSNGLTKRRQEERALFMEPL